jgi:serine/threonine-protein kinase
MTDSDRTVFAPRSGVAIGTRLNGIYEIERLIAAGGMGEVYKGRAIQTGDAVAIKMIRPELAQNENALTLFRKEAAALHNLYNEAIVRYYVFTIDPATQSPYLAMEFVDGQALSDRITQGPMGFEEADILRRRIATGLHAAHLIGITHRDVSPDNIILPGGNVARAKIIDFGIAKSSLMGEGTVIGSGFAGKYNYVSPEQLGLEGAEVTPKSDIYSLGLVLAGALAGRPLDMGGTQMQVLEKRRRVPDLGGVDARMRPLLARMLAPNPDDRPADMAEVAAWMPKGVKTAGTATAPPRSPLAAIGGVCALLLLAGGGFYAWTMMQPEGVAGGGTKPGTSEPPVLTGTDTASSGTSPGGGAPATQPTSPGNKASSGPPPLTETAPKPGTGSAQQPTTQQADSPPSSNTQIAAKTGPEPKSSTQVPPVTSPPVIPSPVVTGPGSTKATTSGEKPPVTPPPIASEDRPATKPTSTTEPPAGPKADPEPRTPAERIERYVSSYDGGACFFLWPTEIAAQKADIEGFGSGAEPFVTFDTAFKQAQGFEAQISLRPVTAAQCPMVDFLRQLGSRIDRSPKLQIGGFTMKSGEVLSGSVETDGKQNLDVVLIGDDGMVYNLASFLKREGGKASFGLKLEATGTGAKPQTVLALVSPSPLPALSGPNPAPATEFFPNLARDIARLDGRLGLGVKYFRIE